MTRSSAWTVWVWAAVWACVLQAAGGQFALVVPAFSFPGAPRPFASPLISLRPGAGAPLTPGARLPAPRRGASTRESEIAAIFRGVAYGAPTEAPALPTSAPSTPAALTSPIPAPAAATTTTAFAATTATATIATPGAMTIPTTTTSPTTSTSTTTTTTTTVSDAPSTGPEDVQVVWAGRGSPKEQYAVRGANSTREAGGVAAPRDMGVVRGRLGAAWWVHVYVSAGLLALVAAAALCCLARAAHASSRPRPALLAAHALVFLAAALRALHLMHDPYGAGGRLPLAASAVMWEAAWPCLTAALALLALLLLRAGRREPEPRPYLARALALLSALHVGVFLAARVAARLLPPHAAPLRVAASAVAATWGAGVGVCLLWAAWRLEQSSGGRRALLVGARAGRRPAPVPALALAASLAQLLLAALHLYLLAAPPVIPARPWAWWARATLCRGLEVVAAAAVVGAAGLLARGRPVAAARRGESAIFSVLSSCGRDGRPGLKGGHVFPEKQQHALRQALKPPPPPQWCAPAATHSVTSDFQLLWRNSEGRGEAVGAGASMLVSDGGFVRFRTQDDAMAPPAYTVQAAPPPYAAQTLPPPARYYCPPSASLPRPRRPSSSTSTSRRAKLRHAHSARRLQTLPPASAARPETRPPPQYEVAPYHLPPPAAHTYATPLGRSAASSLSEEVQVDYLTDASNASSCDVPRRAPPPATPAALTLPLLAHAHAPGHVQGGATPDSAVVLDFSPCEGVTTPGARHGLLTKLVGGGMGGYAPLHVDDASPPPFQAPPRTRRSPVDTVTPL
ncbi:ice-structuring glycoprotein-like [Scylla paramamosain]|uniref:ice-structuring glycoprotein-like n=1 Tax=Scylla paramamosain TaxID=85552 RepID=UPI003082EB05